MWQGRQTPFDRNPRPAMGFPETSPAAGLEAEEEAALLASLHDSGLLRVESNMHSFDGTETPAITLEEKRVARTPLKPPRLWNRISWTWDILAICIVYIVQGFTDLASTAVQYYLKDNLGLGPAEAGLTSAICLVPWYFMPVLGLVTDLCPIFGYHRKAYLLLVGLIGCASWLVLPGLLNIVAVTVVILVANAASAWSQVVADAVTVKLSQHQPLEVAAFFQSISWVTYAAGALIGSPVTGWVLEMYGAPPVFGIMSACLAVVALCGFLITEAPEKQRPPAITRHLTSSTPLTMHRTLSHRALSAALSAVLPASPTAVRQQSGVYYQATATTDEDAVSVLATQPPSTGTGARDEHTPEPHSLHQALTVQAEADSAYAITGGAHASKAKQGPWLMLKQHLQPVFSLISSVWQTLRAPHIFGSAMFVFLWQSTPAPTSAMFYFQTNVLHFSPPFMEFMYVCGTLSGFLGVLVYNLVLVRCSLRGILLWAAVLGNLLNASQLLLVSRVNLKMGLSDELFSLGDYGMLSVLAEVMLTPMMALAARVCPDGIEATLSATLYSLLNLSRAVSGVLGSGLTAAFSVTETNFDHMFGLTLLCNLLMFVPLPLLLLVPSDPGAPAADSDDAVDASPDGLQHHNSVNAVDHEQGFRLEGEGQDAMEARVVMEVKRMLRGNLGPQDKTGSFSPHTPAGLQHRSRRGTRECQLSPSCTMLDIPSQAMGSAELGSAALDPDLEGFDEPEPCNGAGYAGEQQCEEGWWEGLQQCSSTGHESSTRHEHKHQ